MVLVARQADVLALVDGEQGLLPFHFAANWGASLNVVYYLLQHCPDAFCHGGGNVTNIARCPSSPVAALESSDVPVKKKAKTMS